MSTDREPKQLQRWWLIWRLGFNIPALLSRFDDSKVRSIATGINCGLVILTLSFFAWLTAIRFRPELRCAVAIDELPRLVVELSRRRRREIGVDVVLNIRSEIGA